MSIMNSDLPTFVWCILTTLDWDLRVTTLLPWAAWLFWLSWIDWSHLFWSWIVFGCARPPDALDLALPLTSWSCMLNFYTWPLLRSCLSKLTCWFLSIWMWLVCARPPDVLVLALPMTFQDWLVSPDLILNNSTWPLLRFNFYISGL